MGRMLFLIVVGGALGAIFDGYLTQEDYGVLIRSRDRRYAEALRVDGSPRAHELRAGSFREGGEG